MILIGNTNMNILKLKISNNNTFSIICEYFDLLTYSIVVTLTVEWLGFKVEEELIFKLRNIFNEELLTRY